MQCFFLPFLCWRKAKPEVKGRSRREREEWAAGWCKGGNSSVTKLWLFNWNIFRKRCAFSYTRRDAMYRECDLKINAGSSRDSRVSSVFRRWFPEIARKNASHFFFSLFSRCQAAGGPLTRPSNAEDTNKRKYRRDFYDLCSRGHERSQFRLLRWSR